MSKERKLKLNFNKINSVSELIEILAEKDPTVEELTYFIMDYFNGSTGMILKEAERQEKTKLVDTIKKARKDILTHRIFLYKELLVDENLRKIDRGSARHFLVSQSLTDISLMLQIVLEEIGKDSTEAAFGPEMFEEMETILCEVLRDLISNQYDFFMSNFEEDLQDDPFLKKYVDSMIDLHGNKQF